MGSHALEAQVEVWFGPTVQGFMVYGFRFGGNVFTVSVFRIQGFSFGVVGPGGSRAALRLHGCNLSESFHGPPGAPQSFQQRQSSGLMMSGFPQLQCNHSTRNDWLRSGAMSAG